MAYLEKNDTLHRRNSDGELTPIEVALELLDDKPLVKVIPMTKSELADLDDKAKTEKDDYNLILKHCKDPEYTKEEIKFVKPNIASAIVIAIMAVSTGVSQSDLNTVLSGAAKQPTPIDKKKEE